MANGHGGRRPGSGRKPGVGGKTRRTLAMNEVSAAIAEKLADTLPEHIAVMSPKDVMLTAMKLTMAKFEESRKMDDLYMAVKFAKEAAPYEHARLQSTTIQAEISHVEQLSDEELDALLTGDLERVDAPRPN